MPCTLLYLILHIKGIAKEAGEMKNCVMEFLSCEVISFY